MIIARVNIRIMIIVSANKTIMIIAPVNIRIMIRICMTRASAN